MALAGRHTQGSVREKHGVTGFRKHALDTSYVCPVWKTHCLQKWTLSRAEHVSVVEPAPTGRRISSSGRLTEHGRCVTIKPRTTNRSKDSRSPDKASTEGDSQLVRVLPTQGLISVRRDRRGRRRPVPWKGSIHSDITSFLRDMANHLKKCIVHE